MPEILTSSCSRHWTIRPTPSAIKPLAQENVIGCLFLNPSMRTRLSTQIAAQNLGMEAIVFNVGSEGWSLEFEDGAIMNGTSVEHIKDAAPIFGSYFDILAVRTFPSLKNREEDYSEMVIRQFIRTPAFRYSAWKVLPFILYKA
jgi:N-succinyl-L-ornithine transcarbamylase